MAGLTYGVHLWRRHLLPVVGDLLHAPQAEMSFDKGANEAVVFILQTYTERMQDEEAGSFQGRCFLLDVSGLGCKQEAIQLGLLHLHNSSM